MSLPIRFRGDQSDHDVLSKALAEIASLRNDVHQLQIRQPPIGAALNSTDGGSFGGKIKGQFPVVLLNDTLYRTKTATATVLGYNTVTGQWTGNFGTVTVHGDFMRGFFFAQSKVTIQWSAEAKLWYCRDDGFTVLPVTLLGDLVSSGSTTAVSPTGGTITIANWAPYPAGQKLPAGTKLVANWYELGQYWVEPASECPV